ncbi:MAG: hypothetical protein GX616_06565 [Planctomycetes bacterium]|nr:hypothetical protein [Planctomycetota bacterium]
MAGRHQIPRSSIVLRALGCIVGLTVAVGTLPAIAGRGDLTALVPTVLDQSEMFAMVAAGAILQAVCLYRAKILGYVGGALLILSAILVQRAIEWGDKMCAQNVGPQGYGMAELWMIAGGLLIGLLGTLVCLGAGTASLLLSCQQRPLRDTPGPHCSKCGYSLHGLSDLRCPECGTSAIPSNEH